MRHLAALAAASTVAVLVAPAGCAHQAGTAESLAQIQWSGPAPKVAVTLAGSGATVELQAACDEAATHAGVILDGNAAVQAIVTLDGRGARVDILSQRRGVVRSDSRTALSIERVCARAAVDAASQLRDEQTGAVTDSRGSFALTPVPSNDTHAPTSPGNGPDRTPRASGEQVRGPIE